MQGVIRSNQKVVYELLRSHADHQHLVFIASLVHGERVKVGKKEMDFEREK